MAVLLYLDQSYLSGFAKRKPGFVELEPVVRVAVAEGHIRVPESAIHADESAPRLFTGRRSDVDRLRERLTAMRAAAEPPVRPGRPGAPAPRRPRG